MRPSPICPHADANIQEAAASLTGKGFGAAPDAFSVDIGPED
jgi:hypothetical protein